MNADSNIINLIILKVLSKLESKNVCDFIFNLF